MLSFEAFLGSPPVLKGADASPAGISNAQEKEIADLAERRRFVFSDRPSPNSQQWLTLLSFTQPRAPRIQALPRPPLLTPPRLAPFPLP